MPRTIAEELEQVRRELVRIKELLKKSEQRLIELERLQKKK